MYKNFVKQDFCDSFCDNKYLIIRFNNFQVK